MTDAYQPPPGQAPWRVTNVQPGTGQNASGQWVQGNRVSYELPGQGTTGTVFVPNGTSPDQAATLIHQDAQNLSMIRNLSFG